MAKEPATAFDATKAYIATIPPREAPSSRVLTGLGISKNDDKER